jgi:hypothetical protein
MGSYVKTPASVLEYRFDWNDDGWLDEGEEITASEFLVGEGIEVDSEDNDASSATVWLSGGTEWERLDVTNRITTNQGRTDQRTIRIHIQRR